jgi:dimethylsulfone monooxygenase
MTRRFNRIGRKSHVSATHRSSIRGAGEILVPHRDQETTIWAAGLLAATKRLVVFGSVHAPLFHPLIAAKEFVTADHIGEGRFGVNLVVGWNEGEFEMFGVAQREHDSRYDFAQEWLDVVKRAWSEQRNFDFDGQFLRLKGVRAFPKPYGYAADHHERRPVADGASFCASQLRCIFRRDGRLQIVDRSECEEGGGDQTCSTRVRPRHRGLHGRPGRLPSDAEGGADYYHYALIENADWGAIAQMMALEDITAQTVAAEEYAKQQRYFACKGIGSYPLIGTPGRVTRNSQTLAKPACAGSRCLL